MFIGNIGNEVPKVGYGKKYFYLKFLINDNHIRRLGGRYENGIQGSN